jgi:hypothetical protein
MSEKAYESNERHKAKNIFHIESFKFIKAKNKRFKK